MSDLNYNATFHPDFDEFQNNACLGYNRNESAIIASGFKAAANRLSDEVRINDHRIDEMIYPIAYLYRHAIELTLKIGMLATETNTKGKILSHKMLVMWDAMLPAVETRFAAHPNQAQTAKIRSLLVDYEAIDPTSQGFRYPHAKDGKSLLPGITVLNVTAIQNNSNLLLDLLGRVINAFD